MFKKAKYLYAFILFFIIIILFSSNLYAIWMFDTSPPDMKMTTECVGALFDDNNQCPGDSITVLLECEESGAVQSGCKTIEYGTSTVSLASCVVSDSVDNPSLIEPDFSTSFSILNDGETHHVCIESTDRAGNIRMGEGEGNLIPPPPDPPVFIGTWFKLKDASFNSVISRSINLPFPPGAYDADDTTDPYLIIGSGGVVLSPSTYTISDNWQYSESNSSNQDYKYKNTFSPEKYEDYVLSSREYIEINDLSEIEQNKINYFVGNVNSGAIDVGKAPFVLLIHGNLSFNNDFNDSNNSIALIATENINIFKNTESIGGIIAATNISLGAESDTPLKITGNVISTNPIDTSTRERIDDRTRPSFFVVFSPKMYIELFDYLSRATYDWKQLQ